MFLSSFFAHCYDGKYFSQQKKKWLNNATMKTDGKKKKIIGNSIHFLIKVCTFHHRNNSELMIYSLYKIENWVILMLVKH